MYIDFLISLKNALRAGKAQLKIRWTRNDKIIAEILERKGFIAGVEIKGRPSKRTMILDLKSKRPLEGVKIISKPSRREYQGYRDLRKAKAGYGVFIVSTSKGIMTAEEAKRLKVGGEVLAEVW